MPSRLTEGPWSPDAQHGGAPAALFGGEIERVLAEEAMSLARLTVDLLRPVPLIPMRLVTRVVRPGKRVQVVDLHLEAEGQMVARATGLGTRVAKHDVPFGKPVDETLAAPEDASPANWFDRPGALATDGMEVRSVDGDFNQPGPAKAWFRMRVPVTSANPPTSIETTCAAADFGNGASNWDPQFSWLFINPELTIHFARPPAGEWILLDSVTTAHDSGTGLGESRLFDMNGLFGRSAQSLLVEPFGGR